MSGKRIERQWGREEVGIAGKWQEMDFVMGID